jgi:hemolysin III
MSQTGSENENSAQEAVSLSEYRRQKREKIRSIREKARDEIRSVKADYADDPQFAHAKLEARARRIAERKRMSAEHRAVREARRAEDAKKPKRYSMGEEIFNSVSHGIGAGLSVAAIVLLVVRAVMNAPAGREGITITSFAIFGASLFILYIMSTLYHALTPYNVKNVFQIFDHSSIYLLIAGTYTPYCLVGLQGERGWVLFGIIWGLAVAGITIYAVFGNKMRLMSAITYVLMGWLIVFQGKTLASLIPHMSFVLLLTGGVAYTAGCPFYMLKKIKWTHSIFHLFILIGSVLHFFSVYYML